MAQPTTTDPQPPPNQARTPGVGAGQYATPPRAGGIQPSMTGVPQGPEIAGAEPILFEDIDAGLLTRVHPGSFTAGMSEAGGLALEQGKRTQEDGMHLIANVDEGRERPESGTAAAPTDQPSSTRPQTAPARPGEPGLHGQPTAAGVAFQPQQHAGDTPQFASTGQPYERSEQQPQPTPTPTPHPTQQPGEHDKPHDEHDKKNHKPSK